MVSAPPTILRSMASSTTAQNLRGHGLAFNCGSASAFDDLIDELKSVDAHFVVVPTLRHFAIHPLLQDMMVARLQVQARAAVLDLSQK